VSTANSSSGMAPIVVESAPQFALIPTRKGTVGQPIVCRRTVTLIGSRPGCKIVLKKKNISPVHVAIVNNGEALLAVDLVTPNGTELNGLKMEHEQLSDGDIIQIGEWSFRVDVSRVPRSENADLHTLDLDPTPHVVALEHIDSGRILQSNRAVCVIGRRSGCDIVIADAQVSRTQCLLFDYLGHPVVFDLLSRNQTLVNKVSVGYEKLKDGDTITFGDTRFRLRIVESNVGRAGGNGKASAPTPGTVETRNVPVDEIDIESTEKSQRWRIAERLEKANPKT
jgi:pSer/pThr/pTyr-binding forkhead associated (FHA) protein